MGYAIGIILALAVSRFARWTGMDRDRAFYSTVAIVVASYYLLFAVMGGSTHSLIVETIVMIVFVLVAVMGFKLTPWLIVAGLAGHGVFDLLHDLVIENPGVPQWWPAFCLAFDVGAAALLACSNSKIEHRVTAAIRLAAASINHRFDARCRSASSRTSA